MLHNLYLLLGSTGTTTSAAKTASDPTSGLMSFAPIILIFIIMYFLIIRPNAKRQKAMRNMIANMIKGDKVITTAGIHGVVFEVKKATVIVKVDDNTKIEFSKESIASILSDTAEAEIKKQDKKTDNTSATNNTSAAK